MENTIFNKIKKIDFFLIFIYIYLFLPLILFASLWLKPIYAILIDALIVFGIYKSIKVETPLWRPEKNKDNIVKLVLILFFIVLWIITSGVGSSVTQYPDHLYRNALFRMLIDHDWPVRLTYNGNTKAMSYYIGFWLPAALVGKITSYQFAFLFLQIWSVIGIFITLYLIFERKGQIKIWYFIVFVFFGGADAIGFNLIGKVFDQLGNRYEWWAINYNYPGFMTSVFWVYNQVIYAWVTTLMILRQKRNDNIVFIWSTSLLNCTFPAVGIIPFGFYRAFKNEKGKYYVDIVKKALLNALTWQFLVGFILALMSSLYLLSNINVIKYMNIIDSSNNLISTSRTFLTYDVILYDFSAYPWTTRLYNYLWFVFIEFIIHFIIIYKSQSNKSLYWLTLIVLLICPLIEIGGWIDFCMRGSIPALLCLYLMVIDAIEDYSANNQKTMLSLLISFLVICSITCYDTLLGVMQPMANNLWDGTKVTADAFSEEYVFNANNFFSSNDTFFFKYLAR